MFNVHDDQAAGLRRIMAAPKPRIVSVLSALDEFSTEHADSARILSNLAASLGLNGYQAHVVYAAKADVDALKHYGLPEAPALSELLVSQRPYTQAFRDIGLGFTASRLNNNDAIDTGLAMQLNDCMNQIAQMHDIVLVQTSVTEKLTLPLSLLNEGMIIIQMTHKPASITKAYRLIKQLYATLGKRPFGILVHGTSPSQSEAIFKNIEAVARQFLGLRLEYMGCIPADEHIRKASKMGRSVVDAFPMAMVSKALRSLANRLLGHTHTDKIDSNSVI